MKKFVFFLMLCIALGCSEKQTENVLVNLMQASPEQFADIIANKDRYEVQIIYTQINRDEFNKPSFTTYTFNLDSNHYFYPASTVKLPAVLLAFEKINAFNIQGLTIHTPMFHDSVYSGQISVREDTTSETGLPSIAHYAKKILVVSDNDAFNRLYEFIGQEAFNKRMWSLGYKQVRIVHRLERFLTRDENAHTEAVTFQEGGKEIYSQPMLVNQNLIEPPSKIFKGKAFYRNDSLINKPFEFTYKNNYPLMDQHMILKSLIFPDADSSKRFNITREQRKFILQYMSQTPDETSYPAYYLDSTLNDGYCKFFLFGGNTKSIPSNIRIFNKVGDAYGYLIDNAYIVDFDNGVEFMLSAVINTNTDEIYNDEKYEYEKLGFPFLKNLGQLIYQYELKRERNQSPDLSEFKLKYDR